MDNRICLCIDLKSFYASVECVERGLDPMKTHLVVADVSRTAKTICLAATPALKAYGIPGRARLFEVVQQVEAANRIRLKKTPQKTFCGTSENAEELEKNPALAVSYLVAPPRMALYIEYSTRIYNIYLKYVAPEDIHVYSIDEVFMDITDYLRIHKLSPRELAKRIISDVWKETGITATAGLGTNLYLAKIAMDIVAKKLPPDEDGVRIALLDEISYRKQLWHHRPLTDFWRVGKGYAKKLEKNRLYTMGDIARCSMTRRGEDLLYRLFGVNAELLIDHAWGWEPCTISHIKSYQPTDRSVGTGQVLHCPYSFEKAKLVCREMTELLVLELVEKRLVTDRIVLTVGYDIENLTKPNNKQRYNGEIVTDFYGRKTPKPAHGTTNFGKHTSSTALILDAVMKLFDRIVDQKLLVRRLNISAGHVLKENGQAQEHAFEQLDVFGSPQDETDAQKERRIQDTMIALKNKFGKNAVLKGYNLEEGATAVERNKQIGGHKA